MNVTGWRWLCLRLLKEYLIHYLKHPFARRQLFHPFIVSLSIECGVELLLRCRLTEYMRYIEIMEWQTRAPFVVHLNLNNNDPSLRILLFHWDFIHIEWTDGLIHILSLFILFHIKCTFWAYAGNRHFDAIGTMSRCFQEFLLQIPYHLMVSSAKE